MEKIIKAVLPVGEAVGKYLVNDEKRRWTEDFVDKVSGKVVSLDRYETICERGTQVNDIIVSLLEENGIKNIEVSSVCLVGRQRKGCVCWKVDVKFETLTLPNGNVLDNKTRSFIVPADHPEEAEKKCVGFIEQTYKSTFAIKKISEITIDCLYNAVDLSEAGKWFIIKTKMFDYPAVVNLCYGNDFNDCCAKVLKYKDNIHIDIISAKCAGEIVDVLFNDETFRNINFADYLKTERDIKE